MDSNPIDAFISGETPISTDGFVGGYDMEANTVIIEENPVLLVTEPPVVTLESIPLTSEPIPVETEEPKVITDPVTTSVNQPEESGLIFNQPIHKFMSNANPFFIGIGIVVGLILLGDFFKKTEQ